MSIYLPYSVCTSVQQNYFSNSSTSFSMTLGKVSENPGVWRYPYVVGFVSVVTGGNGTFGTKTAAYMVNYVINGYTGDFYTTGAQSYNTTKVDITKSNTDPYPNDTRILTITISTACPWNATQTMLYYGQLNNSPLTITTIPPQIGNNYGYWVSGMQTPYASDNQKTLYIPIRTNSAGCVMGISPSYNADQTQNPSTAVYLNDSNACVFFTKYYYRNNNNENVTLNGQSTINCSLSTYKGQITVTNNYKTARNWFIFMTGPNY